MKHSVPHDLGKETARKATDAAFESYKAKLAKYDPKTTWVSDYTAEIGFSVKGMTLKGTIEVTDSAINMELSVPFLLRPFQGTAVGVIEKEINVWINKARAGEF